MNKYTAAIIGGGPGGYVTAIRLAQFGIKSIVFEKERLGGVCLNHGCIPTKSLVKTSELFWEMRNAHEFGIQNENLSFDYEKILKRKNNIVEKLVSGVEFIFKKRKIEVIKDEVMKISRASGNFLIKSTESEISAKYVILATGSIPKTISPFEYDGKKILSSRDILQMPELPKHLLIIGGGVIGCEFASIFQHLGVQVEIVEFFPNLVNSEEPAISKRLGMSLKKRGIKLHLKTSVQDFHRENGTIIVNLTNGKQVITDKILLSVGRSPFLNIDFDNCAPDRENAFVKISAEMRTNIDNLFAIGDITGKSMLAHTASRQGLIVAEIIHNEINGTNKKVAAISYENIPRCTFTTPEIGSCGLTEMQSSEKFGEILVGKFPFSANGKALCSGNSFGFAEIIADKASKQIVGMHIIGPQATELIAQGSIMINSKMSFDDAGKIIFAHPTLSETIMEAAEDLEKLSIHKI